MKKILFIVFSFIVVMCSFAITDTEKLLMERLKETTEALASTNAKLVEAQVIIDKYAVEHPLYVEALQTIEEQKTKIQTLSVSLQVTTTALKDTTNRLEISNQSLKEKDALLAKQLVIIDGIEKENKEQKAAYEEMLKSKDDTISQVNAIAEKYRVRLNIVDKRFGLYIHQTTSMVDFKVSLGGGVDFTYKLGRFLGIGSVDFISFENVSLSLGLGYSF